MRMSLKSLMVAVMLMTTQFAFTQTGLSVTDKQERAFDVKCDSVVCNNKNDILVYKGDVFIHLDMIQVDSADQVIFDRTEGKFLISGGSVVLGDGMYFQMTVPEGMERAKPKYIEYVLGEKVARVVF